VRQQIIDCRLHVFLSLEDRNGLTNYRLFCVGHTVAPLLVSGTMTYHQTRKRVIHIHARVLALSDQADLRFAQSALLTDALSLEETNGVKHCEGVELQLRARLSRQVS
jgi:hypothetical protein